MNNVQKYMKHNQTYCIDSLVMVSFEWSIHEYTPEDDYIPTGYYIQLYAVTLAYELFDAVAIADGLFLFLLCVILSERLFFYLEGWLKAPLVSVFSRLRLTLKEQQLLS